MQFDPNRQAAEPRNKVFHFVFNCTFHCKHSTSKGSIVHLFYCK
uniref:Uncharacterized protein n=1 Tax=Anguilla anguilla TaxID=7936 RepID=A0A0E9UT42_ANGAN